MTGMRRGYTTGTCAALAAKAAVWALLTGQRLETVSLTTPGGMELCVPVLDYYLDAETASCAIEKDAGDDPDVTNHCHVVASVSRRQSGIFIDGGEGVGRVTKPGLDQPVGAPAINSGPREMITKAVLEVCAACGYTGGVGITISVPGGAALAQKTFNPRLGIVGGISILGTTGIVEPMSEQALLDTIALTLRQRRALGQSHALLTPGNYGQTYIETVLGVPPGHALQVSNFIGDSVRLARELGFCDVLLIGHLGKLVKLAGGMLQTHSRYGDCRMELIAAHAAAAGLSPAGVQTILDCATTDEAVRVLRKRGRERETMDRLTEKMAWHLQRVADGMPVELVVFSNVYGTLGRTAGADAALARFLSA